MIARIDEARSAGDTVGGVFEVVARGVPIGLGSHVQWDRRLDAALAGAVMSIPIVKGVEFGLGFEQTRRFGSAVMDVIERPRRPGRLAAPDEQRRRARGRHQQRPADRDSRRGQADLHPSPPTAVRGSADRPARREGSLRAQRHQRRAGRRSRCRGHGLPDSGRLRPGEVRRRFPCRVPRQRHPRPGSGSPACGKPAARRSTRPTGLPVARPAMHPRPGMGRKPKAPGRCHPRGERVAAWTSSSSASRAAARRRWTPPGPAQECPFIDLDDLVERRAGSSVQAIFAAEGEAGFRRHEREAVLSLGPADPDPELRRVIATGGGAVIDPRNRWLLYRGRFPVWLDGAPEILAARLGRSVNVRPLVAGPDPLGDLRRLAAERRRFYAPALRLSGSANVEGIVRALEARIGDGAATGVTVLRADTPIGHVELGQGIAATAVASALTRAEARRAILLSEPKAWHRAGDGIAAALASEGWPVERILLPRGENAKRLAVIEETCRALARLRVDRKETLVAIGGGALTDAAGFAAATYLRGVPIVHVPTTLVGQIDAALGGKTAVDLPEGKNLVGAFHQPRGLHRGRGLPGQPAAPSAPRSPRRGGQDGRSRRRPPARPRRAGWRGLRQGRGRALRIGRRRGDGRAMRLGEGGDRHRRRARVGPAHDPEPWAHHRPRHRGGSRIQDDPSRRGRRLRAARRLCHCPRHRPDFGSSGPTAWAPSWIALDLRSSRRLSPRTRSWSAWPRTRSTPWAA